ncbi:MAG: peptidase, M56 family protein, partial [Ruminiclostridium sp.]|nr:peptidase, M56 family protein [Ruminiclostridium sp.]
MTAFLTTLLRLSLLGSLLAAVLFLLKPLLRGRVSRAAAYYLWLLVLLRLCVPVGLTL